MNLLCKSENYCATVVQIDNIHPLDGCDNIQGTSIFGNHVIIGKNVSIGDVGLFFPVGSKLSKEYLKWNNLYRNKDLNLDNTKAGYFDENGRIRATKLRGYESAGLFMPMNSIYFDSHIMADSHKINIGDSFTHINDIEICNKYFNAKEVKWAVNKTKIKTKKTHKVLPNQFRFHYTTNQLGKNIHQINPEDYITISYKLHGCAFSAGNLLHKRMLNTFERLIQKLPFIKNKINIKDTEYKNIYSSRKVIKSSHSIPDKTTVNHFYNEDIWCVVNKEIKDKIPKGYTLYGEIVGYLASGKAIQKLKKDYDYGCAVGEHKLFIYRITFTNEDGDVFELSMNDVKKFCNQRGLDTVPILYHGKVLDLFSDLWLKNRSDINEKNRKITKKYGVENFNSDFFLELLKEEYNEKDCFMCKNKVAEEGIVIRVQKQDQDDLCFKQKSFRFLKGESENNEEDIEENESIGENIE